MSTSTSIPIFTQFELIQNLQTKPNNEVVKQNKSKSKPKPKSMKTVKQPYLYIAVIDFEATCEKQEPLWVNEIIEFPVVFLNTKTLEIDYEFHSYVKPTFNPTLTHFCTDLTGIIQSQVDDAPTLDVVLTQFNSFCEQHSLVFGVEHEEKRNTCCFATDGPWDFLQFLGCECEWKNIQLSSAYESYIDLRALFSSYYKCSRMNIKRMLKRIGAQFEGRPHSGIDDSRNIARIARHLIVDGCVLVVNSSLNDGFMWNGALGVKQLIDNKKKETAASNEEGMN